MTKFVILAGIFVLAAIGVFVVRNAQTTPAAEQEQDNGAFLPWIEIIAPSVREQNKDSKEVRELRSGDTVAPDRVIITDASGLADIHFPDGSVSRLDSSSQIVIREANFSAETETLRVRLVLLIGRAWSRTIQLANPESLWEVETANAVATVRGTAFGVEYRDGASSLFVDQNEVSFVPRDPETAERIESAAVVVQPQEFVEIKNEDVPKLREKTVVLKPVEAPAEVRNAAWVTRSKEHDNALDKQIESIRLRGLEGSSLRGALRDETNANRKSYIKENNNNAGEQKTGNSTSENGNNRAQDAQKDTGRQPPKKETEITPRPTTGENTRPSAEEQPRDAIKTAPSASVAPSPAPQKVKVESLRIVFKSTDDITKMELFEEDVIGIRVVARLSDGTERDVTREATLRVLGDIGQIDQEKGIFVPRLRTELRELGKSFGNITATFADPDTGELFFSATPIFEVHTKIMERTPEVG